MDGSAIRNQKIKLSRIDLLVFYVYHFEFDFKLLWMCLDRMIIVFKRINFTIIEFRIGFYNRKFPLNGKIYIKPEQQLQCTKYFRTKWCQVISLISFFYSHFQQTATLHEKISNYWNYPNKIKVKIVKYKNRYLEYMSTTWSYWRWILKNFQK